MYTPTAQHEEAHLMPLTSNAGPIFARLSQRREAEIRSGSPDNNRYSGGGGPPSSGVGVTFAPNVVVGGGAGGASETNNNSSTSRGIGQSTMLNGSGGGPDSLYPEPSEFGPTLKTMATFSSPEALNNNRVGGAGAPAAATYLTNNATINALGRGTSSSFTVTPNSKVGGGIGAAQSPGINNTPGSRSGSVAMRLNSVTPAGALGPGGASIGASPFGTTRDVTIGGVSRSVSQATNGAGYGGVGYQSATPAAFNNAAASPYGTTTTVGINNNNNNNFDPDHLLGDEDAFIRDPINKLQAQNSGVKRKGSSSPRGFSYQGEASPTAPRAPEVNLAAVPFGNSPTNDAAAAGGGGFPHTNAPGTNNNNNNRSDSPSFLSYYAAHTVLPSNEGNTDNRVGRGQQVLSPSGSAVNLSPVPRAGSSTNQLQALAGNRSSSRSLLTNAPPHTNSSTMLPRQRQQQNHHDPTVNTQPTTDLMPYGSLQRTLSIGSRGKSNSATPMRAPSPTAAGANQSSSAPRYRESPYLQQKSLERAYQPLKTKGGRIAFTSHFAEQEARSQEEVRRVRQEEQDLQQQQQQQYQNYLASPNSNSNYGSMRSTVPPPSSSNYHSQVSPTRSIGAVGSPDPFTRRSASLEQNHQTYPPPEEPIYGKQYPVPERTMNQFDSEGYDVAASSVQRTRDQNRVQSDAREQNRHAASMTGAMDSLHALQLQNVSPSGAVQQGNNNNNPNFNGAVTHVKSMGKINTVRPHDEFHVLHGICTHLAAIRQVKAPAIPDTVYHAWANYVGPGAYFVKYPKRGSCHERFFELKMLPTDIQTWEPHLVWYKHEGSHTRQGAMHLNYLSGAEPGYSEENFNRFLFKDKRTGQMMIKGPYANSERSNLPVDLALNFYFYTPEVQVVSVLGTNEKVWMGWRHVVNFLGSINTSVYEDEGEEEDDDGEDFDDDYDAAKQSPTVPSASAMSSPVPKKAGGGKKKKKKVAAQQGPTLEDDDESSDQAQFSQSTKGSAKQKRKSQSGNDVAGAEQQESNIAAAGGGGSFQYSSGNYDMVPEASEIQQQQQSASGGGTKSQSFTAVGEKKKLFGGGNKKKRNSLDVAGGSSEQQHLQQQNPGASVPLSAPLENPNNQVAGGGGDTLEPNSSSDHHAANVVNSSNHFVPANGGAEDEDDDDENIPQSEQ